ncbi:MAG TPA: acyl-CoA dehydrogenase family protein, partial [Stellaceae bacterium]|nr:acyl-CoA dehydrogenase family protein [Stellaceae bacterium]
MTLDLSDEERLIAETARAFFTDKSPVRALRTLRDTKDPAGYSRDLWREMAALGWAGFLVPELWGGVGAGIFGLGLVLEEAGRTLAASPLLSTALIGASALSLAQREVPLRRV